jgi:hypothetical protein
LRRRRAEARRREAVATPERAREARALAIAHQSAHVGDSDRALLEQQLSRHAHPPCEQVLAEARVPALHVRALDLAGRARQGAREHLQGQLLAVVARDDHTRQQVQPVTSRCRVVAHIS